MSWRKYDFNTMTTLSDWVFTVGGSGLLSDVDSDGENELYINSSSTAAASPTTVPSGVEYDFYTEFGVVGAALFHLYTDSTATNEVEVLVGQLESDFEVALAINVGSMQARVTRNDLAGRPLKMRVHYAGTTARIKVWDADLSEPTTWTIEQDTFFDISTSQYVGGPLSYMGVYQPQTDYCSYATGGALALTRNQFATDFQEYTVGTTPVDFSVIGQISVGTYPVASSAGKNYLDYYVSSSNKVGLLYNNQIPDAQDIEFLAKINTDDYMGFGTRVSSDITSGYYAQGGGYDMILGLLASGNFGSSITLSSGMSFYSFPEYIYPTFWLRWKISGSTIQCKAWIDGTNEPASWQFGATNSTVATAGKVGILLSNSSSAQIHFFSVAINGETAVDPGVPYTPTNIPVIINAPVATIQITTPNPYFNFMPTPVTIDVPVAVINVLAQPPEIRTNIMAYDDFESGTTSGGYGWASDWVFTGYYAGITTTNPYQGTRCLRIRSTSSNYATRTVNLEGRTGVKLRFYARAYSFEAGERCQLDIFNGTTWVTNIWSLGDPNDNNIYAPYEVDLSSYPMVSNFQIRFRNYGNDSTDTFYVDNLTVLCAVSTSVPGSFLAQALLRTGFSTSRLPQTQLQAGLSGASRLGSTRIEGGGVRARDGQVLLTTGLLVTILPQISLQAGVERERLNQTEIEAGLNGARAVQTFLEAGLSPELLGQIKLQTGASTSRLSQTQLQAGLSCSRNNQTRVDAGLSSISQLGQVELQAGILAELLVQTNLEIEVLTAARQLIVQALLKAGVIKELRPSTRLQAGLNNGRQVYSRIDGGLSTSGSGQVKLETGLLRPTLYQLRTEAGVIVQIQLNPQIQAGLSVSGQAQAGLDVGTSWLLRTQVQLYTGKADDLLGSIRLETGCRPEHLGQIRLQAGRSSVSRLDQALIDAGLTGFERQAGTSLDIGLSHILGGRIILNAGVMNRIILLTALIEAGLINGRYGSILLQVEPGAFLAGLAQLGVNLEGDYVSSWLKGKHVPFVHLEGQIDDEEVN